MTPKARCWQFLFLPALAVCLSSVAWAGGPREPRQLTAAEERAEEAKRAWRRRGIAAVPEMVDRMCRQDDHLAPAAREVLVELGADALPRLARSSARPRCDLGGVMVDIVCDSGAGQVQLVSMLRDPREVVVETALFVLSSIGSERRASRCQRAEGLVKRATPELRPLLRSRTGEALREVLWAVAAAGPDAAAFVPDLIPLLDKDNATASAATSALQAIGRDAEAAVPSLRLRLRRGGQATTSAIAALAAIGAAARPALPEIAGLLKQALPGLCAHKPRYGDADSLAQILAQAVASIGGEEAEPLVPDMVTAFQQMRSCGLLEGREKPWFDWLRALGSHARSAEPVLLAIVEDADETVDDRHLALDTIDAVGSPLSHWWLLRGIRKALERKREIFAERPVPPMQILPPPPTRFPAVPPELNLCREEAGLPPLASPPELRGGIPDVERARPGFAACARRHLCGPDDRTYRGTMAKCCAPFADAPPWYCARHVESAKADLPE